MSLAVRTRSLVALAGATVLFAAVPASAEARSCGNIAFTRQTEDGVFGIKATGVSCVTARRVARAVRPLSITEGPYEYTSRRFRCRGRYRDQALPYVQWTCRRGSARITFSRS